MIRAMKEMAPTAKVLMLGLMEMSPCFFPS
jgi:hypothetical protein